MRKFLKSDVEAAKIIARADVKIDPTVHSMDHLYGCGLKDFQPVVVSLESLARMLNWQCAQFDGGWDEEEYDNMLWIAKRKFLFVEK